MIETWRILEAPIDETVMGAEADNGDLLCYSPCDAPIRVPRGWGALQALIELHVVGMHEAVKAALVKHMVFYWMEPGPLADFLLGYDELARLTMLMSDFPEACNYVLALPDAASPAVQARIEQGRDLARASLSQRSATVALRGIDIYETGMVARRLSRHRAGRPE